MPAASLCLALVLAAPRCAQRGTPPEPDSQPAPRLSRSTAMSAAAPTSSARRRLWQTWRASRRRSSSASAGESTTWRAGLGATDERITALELRLTEDDEQISEAQAAELALAIKTVANALVQHGAANGHQRVYGELYRRFSISSCKRLPRRRLQEALERLRGWLGESDAEQ